MRFTAALFLLAAGFAQTPTTPKADTPKLDGFKWMKAVAFAKNAELLFAESLTPQQKQLQDRIKETSKAVEEAQEALKADCAKQGGTLSISNEAEPICTVAAAPAVEKKAK